MLYRIKNKGDEAADKRSFSLYYRLRRLGDEGECSATVPGCRSSGECGGDIAWARVGQLGRLFRDRGGAR